MALLLRDKFNDKKIETKFTLDCVQIDVPTRALDTIIKQFKLIVVKTWDNEYDFTSQINRYLDRFYFDDAHVTEGAVLSQYPLQGTRRGDSCIVQYDDYWKIKQPVIATNNSKLNVEELSKAEAESRLYSICALSKSEVKFPFLFSFPLCPNSIEFEMHISVNRKLQHIDIAKASFNCDDELKRFFIVTYALVRWACVNNDRRLSSLPMAVMPRKDIELRDKFDTRNVFLKDSKVYKFFENNSSKQPNKDVMELMGINDVELIKLSEEYSLLSYSYLEGLHEPNFTQQFAVVAHKLKRLHDEGLVHGDVRIGNIIFTAVRDQAYLIDFDYTAKQGEMYPPKYNSSLAERHDGAKEYYKMEFDHDWFSLIYVMLHYFSSVSSVDDTVLQPHLSTHRSACLAKLNKTSL